MPQYIQYKGIVSPKESVSVLGQYWALLFPTFYEGEGFAGTLIDAMASGVPVIGSDWRYNSDIVINMKTGLIVPTHQVDFMQDALIWSIKNHDKWSEMSQLCVKEAKKYTKPYVVSYIKQLMEL